MGVVAIMMLEVAAVIVLMPILKKIRYRAKPSAPDKKNNPMCLNLKGALILLNLPIIKRTRLAKKHLKKPKASGPKCVKANLENGKEEPKKTIAVIADKYDFILLDIISS